MEQKKRDILQMVQNGTITADEAIILLKGLESEKSEAKEQSGETALEEAVERVEERRESEPTERVEEPKATEEERTESSEEEPTMEQRSQDFFEDVRKEVTNVGGQFVKLFQSAFDQVRDTDFTPPFGKGITFSETSTIDAYDITRVLVEVDNGSIRIDRTESDVIDVTYDVTAMGVPSEEKARELFDRHVRLRRDGDTLRIDNDLKLSKVDITLGLPSRTYDKLELENYNGSIEVSGIVATDIKVEAKNGAIDLTESTFRRADLETANGKVYVKNVTGDELEVDTLNGVIFVEGELVEVEAQSFNGNVSVTTTSRHARKLEVESFAGSAEVYVPNGSGVRGELETKLGRIDVALERAEQHDEKGDLFKRVIHFEREGATPTIHVKGETSTGLIKVDETLA